MFLSFENVLHLFCFQLDSKLFRITKQIFFFFFFFLNTEMSRWFFQYYNYLIGHAAGQWLLVAEASFCKG